MAVDFIYTVQEPYFLWVAYQAPHLPAEPPARYQNANVCIPPDRPNFNEANVSDKPNWVRSKPQLRNRQIQQWRAERAASQRELLAIDDGIQRIIDTLKAESQLDNTLIIVTADNGFSWGSHRLTQKYCVYEECSRVFLLIRYPGLSGNRDVAHVVSNVDLAATIAEVAGVTPMLPQDGQSLVPLMLNPTTSWENATLLEKPGKKIGYYAVRVPDWKYVELLNGSKELYDLRADPYELINVAGQPAHAATQSALAAQLAALK
jgi:arylsulfatase A-like enzyme